MLLMNLKAHTPALTLLANLPFEKSEIKADELEIRAVLRAAYDGTRLGPRALSHTFRPTAHLAPLPLLQVPAAQGDVHRLPADADRARRVDPPLRRPYGGEPRLVRHHADGVHQRVLQGQPDGVRAGDRGHRPPVRAAGGAGEGAALPPLPPHDHDAQRPGDQAPLDLTSYCHSSHLSSPPTSLCR